MPVRILSRALFRTVLPTYILQGLSFNAMILDARRYGISYRRSLMLQDIRQFQGLFTGEVRQATLSRSKEIPLAAMPIAQYDMKANYRVYVDVQVQNLYTGETDHFNLSRYTDQKLSPEEYEHVIADTTDMMLYAPGWELVEVKHKVTERAPVIFRTIEEKIEDAFDKFMRWLGKIT